MLIGRNISLNVKPWALFIAIIEQTGTVIHGTLSYHMAAHRLTSGLKEKVCKHMPEVFHDRRISFAASENIIKN